jgi:broad specificity phosphatase PhoE
MATATFYVIRHGQTDSNREQRFQGHADVPLNPVGRQQAADLGRQLAGLPLAAIYSSDLSRCLETARALAAHFPGLPLSLEPRLREVNFGSIAGLTVDEARQRFPQWWAEREANPATARPPGGESFLDVIDRVCQAADEIAARHPGEAVALVTHGGAVRALVCRTLGMPPEFRDRIVPGNCGVTVLRWGQRPRLLAFNCTGFQVGQGFAE